MRIIIVLQRMTSYHIGVMNILYLTFTIHITINPYIFISMIFFKECLFVKISTKANNKFSFHTIRPKLCFRNINYKFIISKHQCCCGNLLLTLSKTSKYVFLHLKPNLCFIPFDFVLITLNLLRPTPPQVICEA